MKKVTVHAAKTNLSQLLKDAEAGEEVVICRGDTPVVRLTPVRERFPGGKRPGHGMWKGQIWMSDDFDAPLPPEWFAPLFPPAPAPRSRKPAGPKRRAR